MGVIHSSVVDINGKRTDTEVRTNKLEDFVINSIGKLLGRNAEWRVVHRVEKRKLRKGVK